jgi:multidrug efflux pump subunit AcrA (membrane-fusion protein)
LLLGVVLARVATGIDGATYLGAQVTPQIHAMSVTFSLPADSLLVVRAGLKDGGIEVTAQDSNGKDLGIGRLTVIDNQINRANGTIRYKATFDNANEGLRPGRLVDFGVLWVQGDRRSSAIDRGDRSIGRQPAWTSNPTLRSDRGRRRRVIPR